MTKLASKGDTWQVDRLTQDDELELEVSGVCVCILMCVVCV